LSWEGRNPAECRPLPGRGKGSHFGGEFGRLGFLTEITLEELYPVLDRILDGKVETERRMRLNVAVIRQGEKAGEYTILNDAVISKTVLARIIHLRNNIDGAYVTTYRGDWGHHLHSHRFDRLFPCRRRPHRLSFPGLRPHHSHLPHTLTNRPLLIPDRATVEFILEPRKATFGSPWTVK